MELNIKDRLTFNFLFPQAGNIITQTLIKEISKKVTLLQDEIEKIELKTVEGNRLQWNEKEIMPKEIVFGKTELEFLKQQVERLDKEKKITQDSLDLCLKIKNEN